MVLKGGTLFSILKYGNSNYGHALNSDKPFWKLFLNQIFYIDNMILRHMAKKPKSKKEKKI